MADYSSNWGAAMGGHLGYDSILKKSEYGGEGDKDKEVEAPKGYKPSTSDQRARWNKFLDYLSEKKVGGSKELDARDKSLGLKYLAEYNKAHPDMAVSQEFIPTAQYESYLIRKKNMFPGLTPEQAKYAFSGLSEAYHSRAISDVDSWLGSLTSRQYYPTFERHNSGGTIQFGTSFEDYLQGVNIPPATSVAQTK